MTCTQGQGWAENLNPFYKQVGLLGHPAIDESCGYGTPVHSMYDGVVSCVVTPNTAGPQGYTFVAIIVDDSLECFEWIVGHLDPAVSVGDVIKKGNVIGFEANHGKVYSGNVEITLAMQTAGDQRGHHRHYQKRGVMPTRSTDWRREYLSGQPTSPYRDPDGYYYQVIEPYNGFNGCQNPLRPVFYRTMTVGMSGYDVFVLQRLLRRMGYLSAEPTAFFGALTAAAVGRFQSQAMGVTPVYSVGPLTRSYLLRQLGPLPDLSKQ